MMKIPYSQLIEYCIYNDDDNDYIMQWLNIVLDLPVDEAIIDEIRELCKFPKSKKSKVYKEQKKYAKDLIKYVNDNLNVVKGITAGFGRKEIFKDLVALLSNVDISKETAFKLIDNKYRVDFTEYSDLVDIIFYTEDWSYIDWDSYFNYLLELKQTVMIDSLKTARFSSKEDLLYTLGIGGTTIEEGVIMAVRKSKEMFMSLSANDRPDTIKAIGEAHGKMQSAYIAMKKEGMLDEGDGSVQNIKFVIERATYEPIDKPEFEELLDDEEYIGG